MSNNVLTPIADMSQRSHFMILIKSVKVCDMNYIGLLLALRGVFQKGQSRERFACPAYKVGYPVIQ